MEPLYFDLETTWMAHDAPLPRVTLGAYAVGDGPVRVVSSQEVRDVVIGHTGPVVGHNLAFDLFGVYLARPRGCVESRPLYDTHVRGILKQAADGEHADTGAGLKDLAKKVGYPMPAKDKKVTRSFGTVRSPDDLTPVQRQYVIDDVEATRAVFKGQGGLARQPDEARQTELSLHVFEMARRGLHIDLEYRTTLLGTARLAEVSAHHRVKASGLIQPRGPKKSPWRESAVDTKLVQARLKASGATRLSEAGNRLAADEVALRASKDPDLMALADLNAARKTVSLVEAWVYTDNDQGETVPIAGDIIRAWYKPCVASGRMSCAGPNLQQIPKKGGFREMVTPRPGNVLVIADFNALELRAWAHLAEKIVGMSMAARLYREGVDLHTYMAERIRGQRPDLTAKEARALAKVMNFGLIGGMGVRRLAEALTVSEEQARQLVYVWFNTFPEAERYFGWVKRQVDDFPMHKVVIPGSGRIRRGFYSEVANVMIQGTGSDIIKDALRLCQNDGLPVVGVIHDEILLDVHKHDAQEAGQLLLKHMETAGKMHCPNVPWNKQEVVTLDRWVSK